MKKIIFVLGVIGLMVGCQNPQKQAEKMKAKITDKINSTCQLSTDQQNKIMPIIDNFVKVREENKNKYGSNEDAFKKANMVNRNHFIDTIKTILSPEQFEKLKDSFQQQRTKQDGQEGD